MGHLPEALELPHPQWSLKSLWPLQVMGIPFVAFDAGGVLEMFSSKLHPDNVVLEPTLEALSVKLNKVGKMLCLAGQQLWAQPGASLLRVVCSHRDIWGGKPSA